MKPFMIHCRKYVMFQFIMKLLLSDFESCSYLFLNPSSHFLLGFFLILDYRFQPILWLTFMMILLLWLILRWSPHIFKSLCVVSVMKHLLGCEVQPECNIILYLWGLNVYVLSPRTLLTLSRYFEVNFYWSIVVLQFC